MRTGIHGKQRIAFLLESGKVFATKNISVRYASSSDGFHISPSVSKRLGNAVVRNRIKRVIRSAFYETCHLDYDFLVRAKRSEKSYAVYAADVAKLKLLLIEKHADILD